MSARVVVAARGWLGTPYHHRASRRGAGADCLGLVRGVWREVVGAERVAVPDYAVDWAEAGGEDALRRALDRSLASVSAEASDREGDVLLFRMREGAVAKHLGIRSCVRPHGRFVHAYARHGVVETSLSRAWSRRVVARFRYPEEG